MATMMPYFHRTIHRKNDSLRPHGQSRGCSTNDSDHGYVGELTRGAKASNLKARMDREEMSTVDELAAALGVAEHVRRTCGANWPVLAGLSVRWMDSLRTAVRWDQRKLTIFLNRRLYGADLRDSFLHELAHALTAANEPFRVPPHGSAWKRRARRLGANATATNFYPSLARWRREDL